MNDYLDLHFSRQRYNVISFSSFHNQKPCVYQKFFQPQYFQLAINFELEEFEIDVIFVSLINSNLPKPPVL